MKRLRRVTRLPWKSASRNTVDWYGLLPASFAQTTRMPKMQFKSIKVARGAMEEVLEGLVDWEYGPAPVAEPEESEEEAAAEGEAAE